jgi:nucleotide-binding universal stress UspA family protein
MPAAKPVLVGTDGSADSLRAVEWAAEEAALRHTPLVIVAALPPLPRLTPPASAATLTAVAREGLERALLAAAERAEKQATVLKVETELLSGRPGPALAERAEDASMLVVSSRGADGFTVRILGSVSRYAAAHARCPVVVFRDETAAVHREIIVGVRDPDLPDSAGAIGFAVQEAELRGARLVAVHAWYWPVPFSRLDPRRLPGEAARHLTEMLATHRASGLEISQDVVCAHPGRVLAGASARADLVVLGRPDIAGAAGLGSVTHVVLNNAHGPVAIIPNS